MKTVLVNSLMAVLLMAIALPAIPARAAIIIGPVAPPSCTPNLNIVSVTYLGKTAQGFGSGNLRRQYTISLPRIRHRHQRLKPTVSRRPAVRIWSHRHDQAQAWQSDSGTASGSGVFLGRITAVVRIPRDTLETDPVSYDATINTTFGGLARTTAKVAGSGAPSLSGGSRA